MLILITTSTYDCLSFRIQGPFTLISNAVNFPVCCIWRSVYIDLRILIVFPFLSQTAVHLLLSNYHRILLLVISVKGSLVSLFQHIVGSLLPRHHRSYILSLTLQSMLLVDEIYLTFLPLK